MARYFSAVRKINYTIQPDNWVDVTAPFSCNYVGIRNRSAADIQYMAGTDVDILSAGFQDGVPVEFDSKVDTRFHEGELVYKLKGTQADQLVTVTWVK